MKCAKIGENSNFVLIFLIRDCHLEFYLKFSKDMHHPCMILYDVLDFQKDPTSGLWGIMPVCMLMLYNDFHRLNDKVFASKGLNISLVDNC